MRFNLPSTPRGTFILHLDAIFRYRRPAPPRYSLLINGHFAASYRLNPHPAPELWWSNGGEGDGNLQYFGYESLEMQLPASAFTTGPNTLSLRCLDGFGIYYDRLSLSNDSVKEPPAVTEASVEPTALYKHRASGLVELATVRIRTTQPLGSSELRAEIGSARVESEIAQREAGDIETTIEVPATDRPLPVVLYLAGKKIRYIAPRSHRDGDGRSTHSRWSKPISDTTISPPAPWNGRTASSTSTLKIQQKYPSYSFTLDAAANLESYLSTRKGREEQTGYRIPPNWQVGNERALRELFHRSVDARRTLPHARVFLSEPDDRMTSRSTPRRRPTNHP